MPHTAVVAPGFVAPRGYQDAVLAKGISEILVLGGHVAFDAERKIRHPNDLVGQFGVVLRNLKATLGAAGFEFEDVVKLTLHVTDVPLYRANSKELGALWRETFGRVFPAMTLIGVTALMEPGCVVEIDGLAMK